MGQFKVFFLDLFLTIVQSCWTAEEREKGHFPFKFENMWLKEDSFKDLLRSW